MNMGNPRKPKNTKATFSRLLGYLGRSKVMLLFVFIFVALSALAGIIGTSFVKTITDDFLLPVIGSEVTKELLAPLIKILITLAIIYVLGVYVECVIFTSQSTAKILKYYSCFFYIS